MTPSRGLAPLFVACAAVFSFLPETQAQLPTLSGTIQLNGAPVSRALADRNDMHKMSFDELLEKTKGDHDEAWQSYEFYQLRRLYLREDVTEESVNRLISQIDILQTIDPQKPIELYIASDGGSVAAGLKLCDRMRLSPCPIHTICESEAFSMAAIIFIAGDKRTILPNAGIMIHQVSGGASGKTSNMKVDMEGIEKLEFRMFQIASQKTGLSMNNIARLASADTVYSAEEAIELGFADKIADGKKPVNLPQPGSRNVRPDLYPANAFRENRLMP